jgi:hypothetical protein
MTRHGRACPGHPRRRAAASQQGKPRIRRLVRKSRVSFAAWMAGTSPAMTAITVFGNWGITARRAQMPNSPPPSVAQLAHPLRRRLRRLETGSARASCGGMRQT